MGINNIQEGRVKPRPPSHSAANSQLSILNSQLLKEYWGYDNFRGIQEDIINSIGEGKDTLGLMPRRRKVHHIPGACTCQRGALHSYYSP